MCAFVRACGWVGGVLMLKGAAGRIRLPPTQLDGSGMELEIKIKPGNIMFFVETWFKLMCVHDNAPVYYCTSMPT